MKKEELKEVIIIAGLIGSIILWCIYYMDLSDLEERYIYNCNKYYHDYFEEVCTPLPNTYNVMFDYSFKRGYNWSVENES